MFCIQSNRCKVRLNVKIGFKRYEIPWRFRPHAVALHRLTLTFSQCLFMFMTCALFTSLIIWKCLFYVFVAWVHDTEQLARHEQCVGGSLSCHRSCGSMMFCQEIQSNEGMYSGWATQKEYDWLAQGLCLAPSLCRRDWTWTHNAG